MAKKDTYLALLRRGIDDTTAQQLADAGLKIGDLKKIDRNMLIENYGLKADIADGVISIINSGHSSHGKERFLASVLAPEKKVDSKIVKLMILLKVISLTKGYSGIKIQTIERLLFFYNNDIFPVVYKYGSLGASGDLAPLSHLSLPLIGLGDVEFEGKIYNTEIILNKFKLDSLTLGAKEGLALINGTQYMLASLIDSTINSINICNHSDLIASVSLDAFNCSLSPFDPLISKIRPYEGQINVSKNILKNLEGGEINDLKKENVQDPYSFRCIPPVSYTHLTLPTKA